MWVSTTSRESTREEFYVFFLSTSVKAQTVVERGFYLTPGLSCVGERRKKKRKATRDTRWDLGINQTNVTLLFCFVFHARLLSSFSDKQWSQVSSLSPSPGSGLQFISRTGFVQQFHCSSIFQRVFLTHALALSAKSTFAQETFPTNFLRVCTRGHSNSRN